MCNKNWPLSSIPFTHFYFSPSQKFPYLYEINLQYMGSTCFRCCAMTLSEFTFVCTLFDVDMNSVIKDNGEELHIILI
jgi:hypothetical protein